MTVPVHRTCIKIDAGFPRVGSGRLSRPLEEYRATAACMLPGAPDAGRTTAFKRESGDCPSGHYVTARNFITFVERPECHGKTLFIHGLDKFRAGAADGHALPDAIRSTMSALNQPGFRLSCREVLLS